LAAGNGPASTMLTSKIDNNFRIKEWLRLSDTRR
jgi:hypothetical protein